MKQQTPPPNRREFLRLSVAAATVSAAPPSSALAALSTRPVQAWVTAPGKLYAPVQAPQWRPWRERTALSFTLDPGERRQRILGFGGAFTDASCYLFSRMEAGARQRLLSDLFGEEGLRLSVGRTCIGSSDYSRDAYSFDDSKEPDPQLAHFSIEHDRAYILPVLREAQQVQPELFLFSSPWSPPGWMKDHNTLWGGAMVDLYFPAYAEYFVRFLKGYAAEGVPIQAVTVQNEVDTNQSGRMPQCEWGQQYEMGFVSTALGPALAKAGLATKIWILDHNYNLWGRVVDELSDPSVFQFVDGVAWHGYVGTPDAMSRVHDLFPGKHAYWTEGGPDVTAPDYATDWAKWSATFTGILRNWARCITSWNLLLDQDGKPDIGPFRCGGVVTLNTGTQALSRSGQYHAFAHYSKCIRRGAQVLGTSGELPGIHHLAAENPDGTRVLVMTNEGGEQRVQCTLADQALDLLLPSDSVTTLLW